MLSFFEFLAQSGKVALPDTHTMLAMAGVPLGFPDEEETQRLLNRDRERKPAGGKAHKGVIPLDKPASRDGEKKDLIKPGEVHRRWDGASGTQPARMAATVGPAVGPPDWPYPGRIPGVWSRNDVASYSLAC